MSAIQAGTVVHRYRIERVLGSGAMGTVYGAVHLETGQRVAVKAMHAAVAEHPTLRKRLLREARAAMAVPHPSIVAILEVFEHQGAPMFAMELLDGESLENMIVREGKLPLDRLARLLVHVTSALGTAHALGIVHRDLKPENIFVTREGRVKVLDFGIAKLNATEGFAAETQALTSTGALLGTPFYMSPEQAFGEKRIDQRADIWSLGIILYRGLSGVLPTRGQTLGEIFKRVVSYEPAPIETLVPGLPADVAELVRRMLAKKADGRPWDLREVHTVLERHANEQAPSFAIAVQPKWEETTSDGLATASAAASSAANVAPPSSHEAPAAKAISLAPGAIRTGSTSPGARTPGGGTLALDPRPHAPIAPTLIAGTAPKSATSTYIVAAIVAIVAAVAAFLAWRVRG